MTMGKTMTKTLTKTHTMTKTNTKDNFQEKGGRGSLVFVCLFQMIFPCACLFVSNEKISKDGDHLTCKVAAMTSCRKAGTANALLRKLKFLFSLVAIL